MKLKKCIKDAFVVIGKEGSTLEGQGFIQRLWADANAHFAQVQPLAKKDKDGNLVGIWGAMSDFSRETQLLYVGDEDTIHQAFNIKGSENCAFVPKIMSRKKQVIPMLSGLWG